ncbi:pilus assembly PilX family protein [Thalassotalea sediminis]|uniref:pilus assembly PilX family protein n=1 Tax=Thalassotalea sediminis TaxID=1759089 RepID=UPI0025723C76|nr:pilus assembly PilX N-terminal domain-containing protein [Thalassotalea sediminis]
MFHNVNFLPTHSAKSQTGSALVIAIFVIVVMSLLGVALVKMLRTSSNTVVYEVLGTRAFQAAQTGMQWQLQQIFPLDNPAQSCPGGNLEPSIAHIDGLKNCGFKTQCTLNPDVIAGAQYYTLTSTGSCTIDDVTTSRTVEVQARSL